MYRFLVGNIVGIYISQNYDIPNIKKVTLKFIEYIKTFEKKD